MNCDAFAMILNEHLDNRCETAQLDFKSEFDPNSNQHWCELIKDIVAMANSGGGIIAVGVNDDGTLASSNARALLTLDPADISNKIQKYTNRCHADFRIIATRFDSETIACFLIGGVQVPLVFEKPGTYQVSGTNQQKSAFSQGTVYFRHGAKSEPGTTTDLNAVIDREMERRRVEWLENIRKVVEAPSGSKVLVVSQKTSEISSEALHDVRLTNSPEAQVVRGLNPNKTHPHRQKEVAQILSQQLGKTVSGHDVYAVRKTHGIDSRPEFCYRPTFSSSLFSATFIDWFASRYRENPEFIESARRTLKKRLDSRGILPTEDERLQWLGNHMRKHGHSQSVIARKLHVSSSVVCRLLQGRYPGDVERVLQRIEEFRQKQL
jgi:hypothetical protein